MKVKNAIKILKKRLQSNPKLRVAYEKEKRNYQIACKKREQHKRAKITKC